MPDASDYIVLRGLDWNTEYEVYVIAENQRGRSEPGTLSFRTLPEPTAIPGTALSLDPKAQSLPARAANSLTISPNPANPILLAGLVVD